MVIHFRRFDNTLVNFYQKKYNEILSSIYKSETLKASQEIEVKYQTEKKEREILLQKAKLAEKNTIIISIISLLLFRTVTFILLVFSISAEETTNYSCT